MKSFNYATFFYDFSNARFAGRMDLVGPPKLVATTCVYSRAEPWRQTRQESGGRTLNRVDSGLYGTRYTLLGVSCWKSVNLDRRNFYELLYSCDCHRAFLCRRVSTSTDIN